MGLFDIGGKFKPCNVAGVASARFIEPHGCEEIDEFRVKYANAEKLATDIGSLPVNFRAFCILDGKFIFGDFIEALIVKNNWEVDDLTISTLSMSQDNVDSLQNLITGDFVKSLNIIVSCYYFANERHRDGLMPYQPHIDAGRFVVKTGLSDDGHAFSSPKFTAKGVSWVAGEWGKFQVSGRG